MDLKQGLLHIWSKFGDPSLKWSRVVARTSKWLTHTHTTHTHTHRRRRWQYPKAKTGLGRHTGKAVFRKLVSAAEAMVIDVVMPPDTSFTKVLCTHNPIHAIIMLLLFEIWSLNQAIIRLRYAMIDPGMVGEPRVKQLNCCQGRCGSGRHGWIDSGPFQKGRLRLYLA